ncbi:MAG: hypothetical protein JWP91_116 [Fibrobacteres bacterium]|nr:hypothetical protein [Fibrobacterota bacterium]
MNSPIFRLAPAVFAALLSASILIRPSSVQASLSEHPEPAKPEPVAPGAVPSAPQPIVPAAPPIAPKSAPVPKPDRAASAPHAAGRQEIISLARKGLLDSAFGLCKVALDSNPSDPFLLLMMGKLSPGGKESSEYFKKAIKAGGTSPEAEESQFRLGQFNYAAGKYHLAIPYFREYLRLFPTGDWKEPAHYWMGNACLSIAQGRPEKAAYLDSGAAWFQKLLDRSHPDDYYYTLALEGLAKAKAAKGDREGAWEAARTALVRAPEEEQSPLLLLSAQLRQGVDRQEEKSLMARLIARYPQSPEARYLRKVNAGLDTSKWKAGSGLPRPNAPLIKDSLAIAPRPADSLKKAGETPALPSAAKPGTQGFTLQLGAFSQGANAQAMMSNLAKLGFKPELVETIRAGKRMYQVRLGRFATFEAASEYARVNLKPHRFLSEPVEAGPSP